MADQQTYEKREAFLREPHVAVLATEGPHGQPHAVPIWYVYEDGVFLMSSGRGSQKRRNVERNPRATLVVDRRDVPYYAVMVQGRVEVGPPPEDDLRLRIARRYLGEELARRYVEQGRADESVTLRLQPERFIEYHGRAGRGTLRAAPGDEPGLVDRAAERALGWLSRRDLRRPVERLLVKYTGYSLLSRVISRQAGVPYVPTLLLTTIGRHTGRRQEIPIFYFEDEQGRYILVGSKGGSQTHPDWYHNLRANPRAWVRLGRREIPVRYEEVAGEERERLWEMVAERWPTYRRYEERAAPRVIPIVALRPTDDG